MQEYFFQKKQSRIKFLVVFLIIAEYKLKFIFLFIIECIEN